MVPQTEQRNHVVDILRGISILSVILLHIDIRIPFSDSPLAAELPRALSRAIFRNGYYGVKIFFVVSGFLITSNILRRWGALDSVDPKVFYKMRFARIAPCLLALLAILSLLHIMRIPDFVIDPEKASLSSALIAALAFHLNQLEIIVGYLPANWDVLWSLSVEEVFYIAFPLLCYISRRKFVLAMIGVGLVVVGPLARTVWAQSELAQDYGYFAGFDCIAIGCAAAIISQQWAPTDRQVQFAYLAGIAFMLQILVFRFIPVLNFGRSGLDVSILAFGTALVLVASKQRVKTARWSAPLRWLGRNSYEVYLTHSFVMVIGRQAFLGSSPNPAWIPIWYVGMIATSGVLGFLAARYFSEPLNKKLRAA